MPKTERNIRYALDEFADWVKRMGQPRTMEQEAKHQLRKGKKNLGNTTEDITRMADNVGEMIGGFVDSLLKEESTEGEKLAKEFDKQAKKLGHAIDDALANEDLPKQAMSALQSLKIMLDKAVLKVSNFLSNLFDAKKEVGEKHKGYTPQQQKGNKGPTSPQQKPQATREKHNISPRGPEHKGHFRQPSQGRGNKR